MAKFPLLSKRLSLQTSQKRNCDLNLSSPYTPIPVSAVTPEPPQSATTWENKYLSDLFQIEGSPDSPRRNVAQFHFGAKNKCSSSRFSEHFTIQQDNRSVTSVDMATETECWPSALGEISPVTPTNKSKRFSALSSRWSPSSPDTPTALLPENRRHTFRNSMFSSWKRKSSISPPLLQGEDSMGALPDLDTISSARNNRRSVVTPESFDTTASSTTYANPRHSRRRESLQLFINPLGTISEKRQQNKDRRKTMDQQLLSAAASGDISSVGLLISAGVKPCRCDAESGLYPIHQAAAGGHIGTLKGLVEHGAKVDVKNKAGRTPLHVAVLNGQVDMVVLLLKMGVCIDEGDKWGLTALHLAATMDSDIAKGAGTSALNGASTSTKTAVDQARLSRAMSSPQIRVRPWSKRVHSTPTMTTLPPDSCLDALIKAGADIDAVNDRGDSPLHLAVKATRARNAKALLDAGANLHARNKDNLTACNVLVSAEHSDIELSRLLIERGGFMDLTKEDEDDASVHSKL